MRRKSERASTKKTKASPEKKVEKLKRTRRGRRKQSTSSENESAEEANPVQEMETTSKAETKPPQTPTKEDSPEEAGDQVWRVKAAEGSGVGEIKKLKICLTRPPSTPERVDRSPRSKRKHSRATSSSDTPSVEGVEEKKKSKHKKRQSRGDKDETADSHGEEPEAESEQQEGTKSSNEVTQSDTSVTETDKEEKKEADNTEAPMSTTDEEVKPDESATEPNEDTQQDVKTDEPQTEKTSDADTTVVSPKDETRVVSPTGNDSNSNEKSPERKRSLSVDKSEILELHPDESKCESSDNETVKPKDDTRDETTAPEEVTSKDEKVSTLEEVINKDSQPVSNKKNETDVVESSDTEDKGSRVISADKQESKEQLITTSARKEEENIDKDKKESKEELPAKQLERSDSTKSAQEESIPNGQTAPAVVTRKRRWGSRSNKLTTQKSITISTDVLKDIIPDVKPVEFEEVIEEKKHKRIEMPEKEKVERPLLPKIVIDNSENVENRKDDAIDKEREPTKVRETHLSTNRKISIVKDNDSIIARPPSPPRHKQSNILYITNLVRPFTLQQLKNLLQRTGRLVDNGFWIDKIKSKCFVKYKSEDEAVETRHALHGVTWPVSNPKTLQVDFSTEEAFEKAKSNEDTDAPVSTMPGTVEDWLWEQDMKRERGELEKPWERKASMREWDMGKNEKDKDKDKMRRDERPLDKRRHRSIEKSPEPARKFKKKEEEAPAKLLDDLFRKTKTTPCIYWLPLSAETIAVKEEQRRQHMAEHERRLLELRRTHRRH